MRKILPILGFATAMALSPLNSNAQSNNINTIKQKNQGELVDNFENKEDSIDYEKIKDMRCGEIINMYGEKALEIIRNCVLIETNKVRKEYGVSIFQVNQKLQNIAQQHATYMATNNRYSHNDKNGKGPWDRANKEGYFYLKGENIDKEGFGQTPKNIVKEQLGEEGHKRTLLDPQSNEIGIGFDQYYNKKTVSTYNFFSITFGFKCD